MEEKLKNYINQIRKQGLSDEQIKKNLKEQGNWPDKDIDVFFNKQSRNVYITSSLKYNNLDNINTFIFIIIY